MHKLFLAVLALSLLIGCGPSAEQLKESGELQAQVMEVHDQVMPYMMKIEDLRTQVEGHMQELRAQDSVDVAQLTEAKAVIKQLHVADMGMRTWMQDWHDNRDKVAEDAEHEAKMAYLNAEMTRVEKVRDDIMMGLDAASLLMERVEVGNEAAEK